MSKLPIEITTDQLNQLLSTPHEIILDIRPVEAYNGWSLQQETRGGHIKGAKSFPISWTHFIFEMQELLESKNILPHRSITIYGYEDATINKMAKLLIKNGFQHVKVYYHFIDEWSVNEDLPMEHLFNYKKLVFPQWLYSLLMVTREPNYTGKKVVICHAHYQNPKDYAEGHIPGAIPLDTLLLESPDTWNRRSPEELKTNLLNLGITCNTTVVLYGRFSHPNNDDPFPGSSAGHLGAIRCAFIMLYAGVKDVRVLNGGITSWKSAGFEVSHKPCYPIVESDFGTNLPACPQWAVDVPEAKKILASPDGELVSIRSWREFIGEVSGYHYITKKGRIPGAIFGNCGSDAYHMENYRNLDHTTREYHEIADMWRQAGITPNKQLAFYCGTGWRGSEAFFNAWLMGWPKIAVFDGGWFEWSNNPNNPVETGEPISIKEA